jgi:hypothetical protein
LVLIIIIGRLEEVSVWEIPANPNKQAVKSSTQYFIIKSQ